MYADASRRTDQPFQTGEILNQDGIPGYLCMYIINPGLRRVFDDGGRLSCWATTTDKGCNKEDTTRV